MGKITKLYYYTVKFDAGSDEIRDRLSTMGLQQAVLRAPMLPDHRLTIEAHEDRADAREIGLAMRRLETLKTFLVEAGVLLPIELQAHTNNCLRCNGGESSRCGDLIMFPRVASLGLEVGDPFLTIDEVHALRLARETICPVWRHEQEWQELDSRYPKEQWKRIVGHESLKQWMEAGALHPLYDDF
jgi:hypothetical protein